jgi:D,D-heptose 1,7-bisphosphate phosphatase
LTNFKNRKNKAIFLDRDGTINREVDNLKSLSQLRLLPGSANGIKLLKKLGYKIIVITNQPVIARGWLKEKELEHIHEVLKKRLSAKDAEIDAIYYCPHHPEATLKQYRKKCLCRKPNTLLLERAIKDFNIDPKKSFIIGDRTSDILSGEGMNVGTILVKTGYGGSDKKYKVSPDHVVKNLFSAATLIKKHD